MDALGIDILVTGSQKALMLPPGLAFIALSERAWKANAAAKTPRFYFDLKRERDNQREAHDRVDAGDLADLRPARRRSRMIFAEGLPRVSSRATTGSRARRARARRRSACELVAPDSPSPATTGIYPPEGTGKVVGYLRDQLGVTFAGGQDQLKGKIVRVAHLGYIGTLRHRDRVRGARDGPRASSATRWSSGAGVGAAQAMLAEGMPRRAARAESEDDADGTYRVLATDPLDAQGVDVFRASPEIELDLKPRPPKRAELQATIGDYDALVIRSGTKVTADTLKERRRGCG